MLYYLCENGCLGFYQGKRLFRERMDRALGRELIRAILSTDGAEALVSGEAVSYLQPKNPRYVYHMRDVVLIPDLLNIAEEYMKISLYEEGGIRDEALWKERFGGRCTVVNGGADWLDMMPLGVNKGTGLAQILSVLGISPSECIAIGDNDNDWEMLELSGNPVAVTGAKPEIRTISSYTTDTVEQLFQRLLMEGELF